MWLARTARERPRHRFGWLAAAVALVAATPLAAAADEPDLDEIPENCRQFGSVPSDARDTQIAWNQVLSLAACMQGTTVLRADGMAAVDGLVGELGSEIAPSLVIYLVAIQDAPGPVQLRAAYHVGLAYVGLITRARSSLPPPDRADPKSVARYHEMQDRLEDSLVDARRAALVAFTAIDAAVADDPSLAPDETSRYMVRHARQLLRVMGEAETPTLQTVFAANP